MAAHWSDTPAQTRADLVACRALLCAGSRSFHLASLLLPRRVSEAATALYAFCRLADDAVDVHKIPADQALQALHAQLDRIYSGQPRAEPTERLLTRVIERYSIPRVLLEALLEGLEWDAQGRRYTTASELYCYAARVAGSIGALMTLLMDVRAPEVVARACDLGVAMQLTNIARDVGEDARAGRIYLPLDWLQEAHIDVEQWLKRPVFSPALGSVVERLLASADALYERCKLGIAGLPVSCRPGIHAARLLYAEIGNELRRRGLDAVSRRTYVGTGRKTRLMLYAAGCAVTQSAPRLAMSPLPETQFLLDAIEPLPLAAAQSAHGGREPQQSHVEWLLELFENLQQRDQMLSRNASAR